MSGFEAEIVGFTAGDGRQLDLIHAVGRSAPTRGPVLLVHGAGVRADIFRPPLERTVVDVLLDGGHDVWLENWRASIDVDPSEWTLDEAAVLDHPPAVRAVLDATGADDLQAIVHCQGSTSFVMSALAGLVPEVRTIVSNAVSVHPVVPALSWPKLHLVAPLVARLTPYLDPSWGDHAPTVLAKALVAFVRLTHHECDNTVCRMVSFTYGAGFPALWEHDNLDDATHEWLRHEFAEVPFSFFAQMARCEARGHLVSLGLHPELPESFVAQPPATDARFVLLAGERNRCFLAESQRRTFAWLDGLAPGRHALHTFPDYGHLDVFLGRRAAHDIGPTILEALQ